MAGAGFKTFTAGEVFTASDANTYLMQQAVMVFTNEAARDAAITAPSEGMHAYLTAPTVPAATGGATYVPNGIVTVYTGSSWVCVTPVGAYTSNLGTTTSTSFTATLSGTPGTNPSVTLTTGTTALVHLGAIVEGSSTSGAVVVSFAVSGATTLAANDERSVGITNHTANMGHYSGQAILVGGLTAGTNTFTMQYKVGAGTMSTYYRRLTVVGIT